MYEWNEEEKKIDFSHNPFSMPQGGLEALDPNDKDPLGIKAFQYDIVCNGYELSSGAIRNHRPDVMKKAFEIAGYGEKDVLERSSAACCARFQLRRAAAWRHGARHRPHRHAAVRRGEPARGLLFPMNQRAEDLLMGAPSEVTPKQLARAAHPATAPRCSASAISARWPRSR
jgi:aspartyl-tRNA synthetase